MDKFKTYNDTCGHPAGDFVLKTVANILKANVRCTDFASRYGGEEFVFILENCDANSAVSIAKEVRHTIETLTWPTIQVTASFGVSTLNATISDEALMIREADIALYRSKRRGRNTVTHADEPADEFDLTNEEMRPYAELLKKMIEAENDTIQSASERVRETLIQVQDITVRSWTSLLDIRDKATLGHSARVTELTVKLAEQCGKFKLHS